MLDQDQIKRIGDLVQIARLAVDMTGPAAGSSERELAAKVAEGTLREALKLLEPNDAEV